MEAHVIVRGPAVVARKSATVAGYCNWVFEGEQVSVVQVLGDGGQLVGQSEAERPTSDAGRAHGATRGWFDELSLARMPGRRLRRGVWRLMGGLVGAVRYGSERVAAERAVDELTGVRNIKDCIDIIPHVDPTHVLVLVQGVLDRYAVVDDDSNVAVTTDGTTVSLPGNVRTWAEHDAVVEAAWMAAGIDDVCDKLSVSG